MLALTWTFPDADQPTVEIPGDWVCLPCELKVPMDRTPIEDLVLELKAKAQVADVERDELQRLREIRRWARSAMATDARNWSIDRTDALLWALLIGWGVPAINDLIAAHGPDLRGADMLGYDVDEDRDA